MFLYYDKDAEMGMCCVDRFQTIKIKKRINENKEYMAIEGYTTNNPISGVVLKGYYIRTIRYGEKAEKYAKQEKTATRRAIEFQTEMVKKMSEGVIVYPVGNQYEE